jgi:uncharacterized protein GlcG (DUF336 family)
METLLEQLVSAVETLVPEFMRDPIDHANSQGHAAFCLIGPDGEVSGRIYGPDKGRGRAVFAIAQRKVTQVWQTGYATGQFETLVYAGKLDEGQFGVMKPDLIGWMGGVAVRQPDGRKIAAAFSGFRGEKDVEILHRAVAAVPGLTVVTH